MSNQMKILTASFILLAVFCFQCKEKQNPADRAPNLSNIPNFKGEWVLEWENGTHSLNLDPEGPKVLFDGNEGLELDLDSVGIRIRPYDEETVKGYFLYSDIKPKSWIGTWENRVVRLFRRD
ncbi:hypothetical protein LEP1GSC202_3399 [Leptospira yanagawae serovar Saopaulo str. Sao Paulo = ATCC 700523]|uniref:Uncharacterized protein n=1 Tax=Leptospira yanagawae serovar Saopaulo str. Sao Paulo = ATCC 700523 TaxID=1249483 RepID=A0A5E8HBI3_9LEPT|nr:hypothetical protein [Leptospira yanagawae]EOQ88153.1 hypothetical protein LEP1GSC202_3399 [Leptospira yanagawae serovar Saopaulo str. Sao Paulo = ATCC 700523]